MLGRRTVSYTKCRTPPPPSGFVVRERLCRSVLSALDAEDPRARVLLVSAPAGAGKTSLLSGMADAVPRMAWVTADRYDNDPWVLWTALVEALEASGVTIRADRRRQLGPVPPEVLASLVNAFRGITSPVWLVLDDVGAITDREALDGLDLLLRRLPDPLRLVLLTRHDPPLPALSDLRLQGRLLELGADDLAFTLEETTQLLAAQELSLTDEDVHQLHERTEGLAAGLRLAALGLRHAADHRTFLGELLDAAVGDYLEAAVLSHLPEDTRRFLLRTSVCAEISPDLAQALGEGAEGHRVLEELVRANALTTRIPGRPRWYRYHGLLRRFLHSELRRSDPALPPLLHARAAQWHAEHGMPVRALEHALAAENADVDLIVLVTRAGARLRWLQPDEAEIDLRQAMARSAASGRDRLTLQCLEMLADLAGMRADYIAMGDHALAALDLLAHRRWGDAAARARAHEALAWSAYQRVVRDAADAHVRAAVGAHGPKPDRRVVAPALALQHIIAFDEGADRRAALRALRDVWQRDWGRPVPRMVAALLLPVVLRLALAAGEPAWAADVVGRADSLLDGTDAHALVHALHHSAHDRIGSARAVLHPVLAADRNGPLGGEAVHLLLAGNLGRFGAREAFAGHLLTRLGSAAPTAGAALDVALTGTELRLLHDLPSLLTVQQIADAHCLSVNTVKTHLRRIYAKLDAHTRRDAVVRAHERGLL